MGRISRVVAMAAVLLLTQSAVASACGFLVAENGAIRLDTFTAASVLTEDGDAHYVTAFSFNGSPESFGAVIPLPDVPYEVVKAPGWFLQRLVGETTSQESDVALFSATSVADSGAEVIASYEVDSLDITVLRGGGQDVLDWADENGFDLGVADGDPDDLSDAVAMLEFYAERSPIFAAIRFDNERAQEQGLDAGQGTPVRFSFHDQDEAWIPVKVLGFDKPADEVVVADLFLLTPGRPTILGGLVPGTDITFQDDYDAGSALVRDLVDDERAEWVPRSFTLTRIDVRTQQRLLEWDVAAAVDAVPDTAAAFGVAYAAAASGETYSGAAPVTTDIPRGDLAGNGLSPWWWVLLAGLAGAALVGLYLRRRHVTDAVEDIGVDTA